MKYQLRPRNDMCGCGHYNYFHGRRYFGFGIFRYDLNKPCIECECPKFTKETIEERNAQQNMNSESGN